MKNAYAVIPNNFFTQTVSHRVKTKKCAKLGSVQYMVATFKLKPVVKSKTHITKELDNDI